MLTETGAISNTMEDLSSTHSVLRRRGHLQPIQIPSSSSSSSSFRRELQTIDDTTTTTTTTTGTDDIEDEEFVFNIVYVSPCQVQVSNDPLNPLLFVDDIIPCNITLYDCHGGLDNLTALAEAANTNPPPYKLVVNYDYEIHYQPDGGDLEMTIAALEGSMLKHIASITGLDDCPDFVSQRAIRKRRRRQRTLLENEGRFLEETDEVKILNQDQEAALLGISSSPDDATDSDFNDCIVPVAASDIEGTVCQPIEGSMTAFLHYNTAPTIEDSLNNALLRIIRTGMLTDVYTGGNLKKVSFIGTRANAPPPTPAVSRGSVDNNGSNGEGLTTVGVTFIAVGAVLVFALCAIFAMRRQQQQQREKKSNSFEDDENVEFHDATIHPEDLVQPNSPGSLAAMDTLALQPSNEGKFRSISDDDGDEQAKALQNAAALATSRVAGNAAADIAQNTQTSAMAINDHDYELGSMTTDDSFETALEGGLQQSLNEDSVMLTPNKDGYTGSDLSSSPTSSLDGADEGDIISRLHSMSEAHEGPLEEPDGDDDDDDDDEDQNYRLRRIA